MKTASSLFAIAALSICASAAVAFELPKATSLTGASSGSADATGAQEIVVKDYTVASVKITEAQLELATAFGLKDQAAALAAQAAALGSGATLDKDAIEKQKETSDAATKAIQEKLAANAALDAEGKKHVAASLSPFAIGVVGTAKMGADISAFSAAAKQQISSASLIDKLAVTNKLKAGTYLAAELPGYSTRLFDTFKKLVTYSQNNGIPVPPDATAALSAF